MAKINRYTNRRENKRAKSLAGPVTTRSMTEDELVNHLLTKIARGKPPTGFPAQYPGYCCCCHQNFDKGMMISQITVRGHHLYGHNACIDQTRTLRPTDKLP